MYGKAKALTPKVSPGGAIFISVLPIYRANYCLLQQTMNLPPDGLMGIPG